MAIRIVVRGGKQIIVPVRLGRAVAGVPARDAPDVDDRGFQMGNRPGTWGASDCRGAMIGITEGDTVRVKVRVEDLDAGAPLYVTSSDGSLARIVAPAGHAALGNDGVFKLKGVQDSRNKPVKIMIRLGAADGPILGELEPHIFKLRRVRVVAHLVTIDGVATATTAAGLVAHFQGVNDVWRPAGLEFIYRQAETVTEEIVGTKYKKRDGTFQTLPLPMGATSYATAGTVTTNFMGSQWEEFSTLLQIHIQANVVNIYFVKTANEFSGLTYDKTMARPNGYGVVIVDSASPTITAHELGHFLGLPHSDIDAAGTVIHHDVSWARRMMHSRWPALVPPYRNDTGYGAGLYGALIAVKNLQVEPQDNETQKARTWALNPY
jgi:hypothetical protein